MVQQDTRRFFRLEATALLAPVYPIMVSGQQFVSRWSFAIMMTLLSAILFVSTISYRKGGYVSVGFVRAKSPHDTIGFLLLADHARVRVSCGYKSQIAPNVSPLGPYLFRCEWKGWDIVHPWAADDSFYTSGANVWARVKITNIPKSREFVPNPNARLSVSATPIRVSARGLDFTIFILPLAIPTIASLGLIAFIRDRSRRRTRSGLCLRCGYDLRMSGTRCPECGTAATARTNEQGARDSRMRPARKAKSLGPNTVSL